MVTVLRSVNVQTSFRPGLLFGRLAGVVYDGPVVRGAVVGWSMVFVELAGAIVVDGGLAVRRGVGPQPLASMQLFLTPGLTGGECRVGGLVVMDLDPGDVVEVRGFADDVVSFELVANGLTVVVS